MDWFSDLVSGSGGTDTAGSEVDPAERARQLEEGVVSSARALGDEHAELSRRAQEAARRIADGLSPGEGAGDTEVSGALDRLDGLHFALLRVAVRGETPDEAGLGAALESAEELAERTG